MLIIGKMGFNCLVDGSPENEEKPHLWRLGVMGHHRRGVLLSASHFCLSLKRGLPIGETYKYWEGHEKSSENIP